MVNIGQRIQDRRRELNLSIEEIAKRLNKNRTTVYRYERGDIGNLPLETLKPLAEILETTPAYLMGWEDKGDSMNETTISQKQFTELLSFIDAEEFTKDECYSLITYAKFIVYQRNIK